MARIWQEPFRGSAVSHRDNESVAAIEHRGRNATLLPRYNVMVRVASFTFQFSSIDELRMVLSYYAERTHPSSRVSAREIEAQLGPEWKELRGWDVERWFERLPMYLLEEPKRQKVVKALTEALQMVESGELQFGG